MEDFIPSSFNFLGTRMALFKAASKHFVKSAGNSSLHNVPDLSSADRFNVLCLVYRKRSFWPWKKPKIIQTMVTLSDLFEKVLMYTYPICLPFYRFNAYILKFYFILRILCRSIIPYL